MSIIDSTQVSVRSPATVLPKYCLTDRSHLRLRLILVWQRLRYRTVDRSNNSISTNDDGGDGIVTFRCCRHTASPIHLLLLMQYICPLLSVVTKNARNFQLLALRCQPIGGLTTKTVATSFVFVAPVPGGGADRHVAKPWVCLYLWS